MSFRKIIFWCHLAAGLIAGVSIGIMCFTGTALAFEKQLIAWAERDARRIEPPTADAPRLPLSELDQRLRAAHPDARPTAIVVQNDPAIAIAFSAGRAGTLYADPYTGEIRAPASRAMGEFMQTMIGWHRYLNFSGDASRPRGKLVNGICNVAFCVLAVTGLYLWLPRTWSWRALRPGVWFTPNATSKARDWNWHNVIGFWSAPILIVLTLTAMPISFRWAGNVIATLTGTPPPPPGAARGRDAADNAVPAPPPGAEPLTLDALIARAQLAAPAWETITYRLPGSAGLRPATSDSGRDPAFAPGSGGQAARAPSPQPVTFTIRESGTWPRTANTTLVLNPFTGDVLRRTGYADQNAAQQVRSWTRFLHTGEAVGWPGQLLAGLASLGGCFLVYTGFALSWRRFFGRKPAAPTPTPASRVGAAPRP